MRGTNLMQGNYIKYKNLAWRSDPESKP